MSARAVTLWFIDTDAPVDVLRSGVTNDVDAAKKISSAIYGDSVLVPSVDTNLATAMDSDDSQVFAGSYGPLTVVSCSLFATSKPSTLTRTVETIRTAASIPDSAAAVLLYTEPDSATGVFARWEGGTLRRSFAADPVSIIEDEGLPYPFEKPFWAGEHPLRYAPGVAPDPLALPFHPQQLAEQGNREWLGFRFTRPLAPSDLEPLSIPVTGFAIRPADYEPTDADAERYREASATAAAATAAATAAAANAREQLQPPVAQAVVDDPRPALGDDAGEPERAPEQSRPSDVVAPPQGDQPDEPPSSSLPVDTPAVPVDTPAVGIPVAEPIDAHADDYSSDPATQRPPETTLRDEATVREAVTEPVPPIADDNVGDVDEESVESEYVETDQSEGWTRRVARYFGFGTGT